VIGAILTNKAALVRVPAGDWLAFVGGLLGVSLTILGTVALEQWKRQAEKRGDRELIIGALEKLAEALDGIPQEDEQPGAFDWDAKKADELLSQIDEATDLLKYARLNTRLSTVEQVLKINRAEKEIAEANVTLEREQRWIAGHGNKPNVLEKFNSNIRAVAEKLRPPILEAVRALKTG
jgi:hypothetical protein